MGWLAGASPLTLLGATVFATSLLGILLTGFSSPTVVDWWQTLTGRPVDVIVLRHTEWVLDVACR